MPLPVSRRSFVTAGAGIAFACTADTVLGRGIQDPQKKNPHTKSPHAKDDADKTEEKQPVEAEFERDYDAPSFKPKWARPQINRTMVQDFVIFGHSDLAMVKKMLEREPGLLNAAMDWGTGDWETAMGGASHMGRKDIVKHLWSLGGRSDIFTAAMMGMLDVVKALLTLEPNLIDSRGPHGFFNLHIHAAQGGKEARPVYDYLQSIKEVKVPPHFLKN